MIENIKQIGLFMIVAQTFLHFTAGQSYEKYIKIITSVIVLLLFVRPFTSELGNTEEKLQKEMKQLTEQMENHSSMQQDFSGMEYGVGGRAIRQMEEEIKRNLNRECMSGEFEVTYVMFEWEGSMDSVTEGGNELWLRGIQIFLSKTQEPDRKDLSGIENIQIERVSVSDSLEAGGEGEKEETESNLERKIQEYRSRFAQILGIGEEQVEVIYSGRR